MATERTVGLAVEGMTCGGCATAAREALERLAEVRRAEVDLARGTATVAFDGGEAAIGRIIAAVAARGFVCAVAPARGVAANPSLAVPAGYERVSFRVADLETAAGLAEIRDALKEQNGVRDAGAHRRSDGSRAGIAWAVYDPALTTAARLGALIERLGYEAHVGDGRDRADRASRPRGVTT